MSSETFCESIPFTVVHASSEHLDHPGKCLETKNADTLGWQSAAQCTFPQHIIIKLLYPPNFPASRISLTQIKVLTHETKIPKRIEIFLSKKPCVVSSNIYEQIDEESSSFQRLGYVSFDCNERSNFRARELKSIKLGGARDVSFIKLVLHECHSNEFNLDSQVGIVNITVMGELCATSMVKSPSTIPSRIINNHGGGMSPPPSSSRDIQKSTLMDQNDVSASSSPVVCPTRKKKGMGHAKRLELVIKANESVEMEVKHRVDALERLKHMKAAVEDYDAAARVKEALVRMRSLQESFHTIQQEMYQAAQEEDYTLASQLKDQRDQARESLLEALDDIGDFASDCSFITQSHSMEDVSLSTISIENPPPPSSSMTREKIHSSVDDKEDGWDNNPGSTHSHPSSSSQPTNSMNDEGNDALTQNTEFNSSEDGSRHLKPFREHPLHGVPGYEELPIPEEILFEDGHVSPEALQKVDALIGVYLSKCFFSKNWSLREAAILKTSIILPSLRDQVNKDVMYRGLLLIAERALEDRIVQVVLTALVFVDNVITEFEKGGMTPRDAIPLLTPIILNLMGKLGDSKPKVVDTAEKALMSFALSTCIGPSHIAHHLVKRTNMKDMKGGKALVTRFVLLRQFMDDFDLHEGPSSERLLEFIRECGMNHKEAEVRDAAKDLAVVIYMRDGGTMDVLSMLEGLSDRQMKEYKIAFAIAKKARGGRGAYIRDHKQLEQRVNVEEINRPESPEAVDRPSIQKYIVDDNANTMETSVVRGRGRGRGRANTNLQPQHPPDSLHTNMTGSRFARNNMPSWPSSKIPSNHEDESDFWE